MREIKFRGITFKGDWVYGDLSNDVGRLSFDEKQWIRNNLTENISEQTPTAYWQETTKRLHWNQGNSHYNAPVRLETVGQFTGLKDKNGKEIFEGDLVSVPWNHSKFAISFKDGCYVMGTVILAFYHKEIEVIGNIYETPTS
jgi:uncharacterized phage protein (TIGR01671 family)